MPLCLAFINSDNIREMRIVTMNFPALSSPSPPLEERPSFFLVLSLTHLHPSPLDPCPVAPLPP